MAIFNSYDCLPVGTPSSLMVVYYCLFTVAYDFMEDPKQKWYDSGVPLFSGNPRRLKNKANCWVLIKFKAVCNGDLMVKTC